MLNGNVDYTMAPRRRPSSPCIDFTPRSNGDVVMMVTELWTADQASKEKISTLQAGAPVEPQGKMRLTVKVDTESSADTRNAYALEIGGHLRDMLGILSGSDPTEGAPGPAPHQVLAGSDAHQAQNLATSEHDFEKEAALQASVDEVSVEA